MDAQGALSNALHMVSDDVKVNDRPISTLRLNRMSRELIAELGEQGFGIAPLDQISGPLPLPSPEDERHATFHRVAELPMPSVNCGTCLMHGIGGRR